MPEYAYKCLECSHEFSVKKRIAEATREEACPECGCETRRVWLAPAVAGSSCGSSGAGSVGGG